MLLIGFLCGIITGLLSVGGGIVLIFTLIFVLPTVADINYSMQTITGFSIMQTFFSTLSGGYYYFKNKIIDSKIVLIMGVPAMIGGVLGSVLANQSSDFLLQLIFAVTSVIASLAMQIPRKTAGNKIKVNRFILFVTALVSIIIGLIGGMVGLGAGFLFIPIMIHVLKMDIRKAIGSSLLTAFLLSTGSFITKLSSGSIPILLGASLIIGAVIGAQIGGRISAKINPNTLKKIAGYAVIIIGIRSLIGLF